ncbi:hypothetical protein TKK_0013185 [Trichogramma kaykai]|uniref:Uncharacterized protein n=1 Tax=Trichogramma kaykai TaxID=54128 RepID=A0ABD2WK73_9HYME
MRSITSPIKIPNPSSRSVLSSIENVDVKQKTSIFDVSGRSSPLLLDSESEENENSPPRKLAKHTSQSGYQPLTIESKTAFEPEVNYKLSCSPSNQDFNEIIGVPYLVPILNSCGRSKGAVLNAFGLKYNTFQLEPYGNLHIDIRAMKG